MVSNSKLSGAQRKKLQKGKYDKHNGVIKIVKKLDNFRNVLLSNPSKITRLNETTPSYPSSVIKSEDSNVASSFFSYKIEILLGIKISDGRGQGCDRGIHFFIFKIKYISCRREFVFCLNR